MLILSKYESCLLLISPDQQPKYFYFFTGRAAHARAAALGIDFSSEVQRWYAIVACTIQKTNAKVLRGDPSPITVSAPDRWLRALGRFDLPVV